MKTRMMCALATAVLAMVVWSAEKTGSDGSGMPRVIFDTDMYTDYDDVGALAMLHALADAGECELLAVGCNSWGDGNRSVAACEVVNAYYGRADLPVGCARSGGQKGAGGAGYGLPVTYAKWVKHLVSTNAPLAVDVYREVLARAPDKSVVLCSVGFLNNVADLLRADAALVERKVRLWVAMACSHPKGSEYNSSSDGPASEYAFTHWPKSVPIVWTDFQYGHTCYSGRAVAELPVRGNPVKDVFAGRLTARDKVVPGKSWDQLAGHPSWDETAVLIAVRGWEKYFNLERGRHRMIGKSGQNEWVADPASTCGRVTEKLSKAEVGRVMDELMCRVPVRPSAAMQKRLDAEEDIIGIVHWGLNTFTDREWGFGDEDPKLLAPDAFDADQIVGACKAAGIRGLVVVAKHHDGFCLWPTKTTAHNISKSPFRNGKGDYVKEMSEACRRAGIKFGVYCSPWDRNNADYATEKYVETYHAQVRELNDGRYGEIFEMWFDGANGGDGWYGGAGGGKGEKRKIAAGYYRFPEVLAFLRKMQPDVTFFCGDRTAEYVWPGNEQGQVDPAREASKDGVFRQWEADFPLRPGWFYHASQKGKTKGAAYLLNRYLSSVGNGGTMNIGIAPDRHGRLDAEDVRALKGFGELRKAFFSHPVRDGGKFNVVVVRKPFGVKRILQTSDAGVTGARYWVDPGLLKLANEATTESGETDTAKWMTGAAVAPRP